MNGSEHALDNKTHDRIFREVIVPNSGLNETSPQVKPRAIILAGQPGAGKGNLERVARSELRYDVVTIDPDALRDGHTDVDEFRAARPYTWADDTHEDASRWSKELRSAATEGRRHVIADTTLGNAESAERLIKELQGKGYEVEIRAIATHRIESELGVDVRFTSGVAERGHGRYVPASVRADVYEKLPANLDHVGSETGVQIRIFNREGAQLYDSRTSPLTPGAAMEQAREARLADPKITKSLNEGLKAQQALHQELPEALARNPKVPPATAQALLTQRSELKVVDSIDQLAVEAARIDYTTRVRPRLVRAGAAAGVVGAATAAYDATTAYRDVTRLSEQGNQFGAESKIVGAVSRNVGGLGGVALGAATGAAVTAETGPGALVGGAIGGVVGAFAGDKAAEWIDRYRINHQDDNQGNTWTFNPKQPQQGWTRRELDLDAMTLGEGVLVHKPQLLRAEPALADQLNYQASNRAIELALSAPPKSRDPYTLPAGPQDLPSLREIPWRRDPQTQAWSRQVIVGYLEHGIADVRPQPVTPQRAAELEKQSQAIIADNATKTPAALAVNYQTAYDQYGWSRHGKVPPAVTDAVRHPGRVVASDGDLYVRDAQGQWTHDGVFLDTQAKGNLKRELDATYERQQQNLKVTDLAPVEVRVDPQQAAVSTPTPQTRHISPEDAAHPDHALYDKVRGAVAQLDRQLGKPWDDQSERMTASALTLAVEKNFEAKDDIRLAFNNPTATLAAGEFVHVYRVGHSNPDPAAHHASMKTAEALATPVEDRYRQVEGIRVAQNEQVQQQLQEQARMQGQGGPKMMA